jgi:protein SDA1
LGKQYRHYQACLQLFQLKPSQDSKEFADCITFIAQVGR